MNNETVDITNSLCCKTSDAQQCCSQEAEQPTLPMQESLETCQKEVVEWRDKYMRINADFENFKRRSEREKILWMRTGQTDIMLPLLSIIDDFDRAMAEQEKAGVTPEMIPWLTGFTMIAKSLHKFLQTNGIEEISEVAIFDPELHEAISSVEIPGRESGEIIEVLQKGYRFKGELLRPAKVAVVK